MPSLEAVPAPVHVLAIDDDPSVRQLITDYLTDNDIQVTAVASGKDIGDVMARHTIDLLILDLKLPGEDGMQIARSLRAESMCDHHDDGPQGQADRVMGLGRARTVPTGRSLRVSYALRCSAFARPRAVADGLSRIRAYRFAGWELNVRLRRLKSPLGETIPTTNSEFNLLVAFLAAPQRVLSREQLLERSRLHDDEVYDRSVDVQVGRLRRKIEPKGTRTQLIRTERGAGYVFTATVETVR